MRLFRTKHLGAHWKKLHRTKCSRLITEVISPALESELITDVQGKKYSVLIDKSTDIVSDKNLCIWIRYPSEQENKIMTAFVGLVPVVEATGEAVIDLMKKRLAVIGLELRVCVGLGCDGASAMLGYTIRSGSG